MDSLSQNSAGVPVTEQETTVFQHHQPDHLG